MGNSTAFELAILLSLRDAASGKLDRFEEKLRATGKQGRNFLQEYESLRKSMGREISYIGAGFVGLNMLKKGVNAAADYETSLLDLRSAYQELESAGGKTAMQQAADINSLMQLATGLGNNLQGSTADYVGILTSLKKAGVDTETVLGGAGDAAAKLANVSGALNRGQANEQAKELGQFGKLFNLNAKDFGKSVDLFSALKDRFDIESGDLIESAKYFNNTARGLKLTGFEGASETSKFFALMKRQGALEGSQAGTSATSLFQQFIAHADELKKIKKTTGLDLKLFDKKGEFLGMENAFREMEKFRKFSSEKRLEILNKVFGEQGGKVAGVMADAGAEGWRSVTTEAAKAVPVQEKINQQMATYNAKMEAVLGTLDNIKAVTFTPILDSLKPVLDNVNSFLGSVQEFSQGHQEIAKYGTEIVALGSSLLILKGTVGALTTTWRLWRIASDISKSGNLIEYFARLRGETAAVGSEIAGTSGQARGLSGTLSALSKNPVAITIGLTAASIFTISEITDLLAVLEEKRKADERLAGANAGNLRGINRARQEFGEHGMNVPREVWQTQAGGALGKLNSDNQLRESLGGWNAGDWFSHLNPVHPGPMYGSMVSRFSPSAAAATITKTAPELREPEIMAEFRKLVDKWKLPSEQREKVDTALKTAFPESFAKSADMFSRATQDTGRDLGLLDEQAKPLARSFADLNRPASSLPSAFDALFSAAYNNAERLNSIQYNPPTPTPAATGPSLFPKLYGGTDSNTFTTVPTVPRKSSGGIVRRTGFAEIHEREAIVPAVVTDRWRDADEPKTLQMFAQKRSDPDEPRALKRSREVSYEEVIAMQRPQRSSGATKGGDRHFHIQNINLHAHGENNPEELFERFYYRLAQEEAIADERA